MSQSMKSPQHIDIEKLIAQAADSKGFLRWPLPLELESSPAVAFRNNFARVLAKKSVPEILRSYVYLTQKEMKDLLDLASQEVLDVPLHGIGIELGAGCGLLSSIVALGPAVEAVLALEICEEMASQVMPKVAASILSARSSKVIPVVGSFDDIQLPDNSLDFAVEIDSLHHSDNLKTTLKECARVLKPGGRLLCLDRAHPNSLSDQEVDKMLSYVYPRKFLIENSYPPDIALTRRQNGEHEYRLFEWEDAFRDAGLDLVRTKNLYKPERAKNAIKGLRSLARAKPRGTLDRADDPTIRTTLRWISQQLRLALGCRGKHADLSAKETTVFLLKKT
jgi:ubiquinone/menaquinone biosynthesis C-methylase UbiE